MIWSDLVCGVVVVIACCLGFTLFFVGFFMVDYWLGHEGWRESVTVKELRTEYRAYCGQCSNKRLAAVSFAQYVIDVVLPRERRDAVKTANLKVLDHQTG